MVIRQTELHLKRDALELAEKTGSEKIAGRDCDVYVQEGNLMGEETKVTIWPDKEIGLSGYTIVQK